MSRLIKYDFDTDSYEACLFCLKEGPIKTGEICERCGATMPKSRNWDKPTEES